MIIKQKYYNYVTYQNSNCLTKLLVRKSRGSFKATEVTQTGGTGRSERRDQSLIAT